MSLFRSISLSVSFFSLFSHLSPLISPTHIPVLTSDASPKMGINRMHEKRKGGIDFFSFCLFLPVCFQFFTNQIRHLGDLLLLSIGTYLGCQSSHLTVISAEGLAMDVRTMGLPPPDRQIDIKDGFYS